jgi:hypothetical protein
MPGGLSTSNAVNSFPPSPIPSLWSVCTDLMHASDWPDPALSAAIYPNIVNLSRRPYCPPLPPSSAIHLPFPPSSTFPAIFPAVFSPANYFRCVRYILSHHCASLNTSAIAWIPRTSTSRIPWTNQTSHTPKFSMISRDASGRRLSRKVGRLIRNLS